MGEAQPCANAETRWHPCRPALGAPNASWLHSETSARSRETPPATEEVQAGNCVRDAQTRGRRVGIGAREQPFASDLLWARTTQLFVSPHHCLWLSCMLALFAAVAPLQVAPLPKLGYPYRAPARLSRAGHVFAVDPASKAAFVELIAMGGTCVQEGEMGKALGYFKKALAFEPTSETTKTMIARLEAKGFLAEDEDGTIDV